MAQHGSPRAHGPHSTPLIVGNRVFAASSRSESFALDKTTGKHLWSHQFVKTFNAPLTSRGYGGSPLLYNDTEGAVLVAKNHFHHEHGWAPPDLYLWIQSRTKSAA